MPFLFIRECSRWNIFSIRMAILHTADWVITCPSSLCSSYRWIAASLIGKRSYLDLHVYFRLWMVEIDPQEETSHVGGEWTMWSFQIAIWCHDSLPSTVVRPLTFFREFFRWNIFSIRMAILHTADRVMTCPNNLCSSFGWIAASLTGKRSFLDMHVCFWLRMAEIDPQGEDGHVGGEWTMWSFQIVIYCHDSLPLTVMMPFLFFGDCSRWNIFSIRIAILHTADWVMTCLSNLCSSFRWTAASVTGKRSFLDLHVYRTRTLWRRFF